MQKVRWIRLDIPYQSDGSKMRAVVGHSPDGGKLSTIVSDYYDNIPNIINALNDLFKQLNLATDNTTVLAYPLDGRMNLAWVVKEAADKEGWEFSRHVPRQFYPGIDVVCSFELEDTGSEQDSWAAGPAQKEIFSLNNAAQEDYQGSDMPSAMSNLRQALQLAIKHFGWGSPGTAYSLTNFGHVMRATGNDDNLHEVKSAIERMLHHWDNELPSTAEWEGASSILEQLIMVCAGLGANDLAARLKAYEEKLV